MKNRRSLRKLLHTLSPIVAVGALLLASCASNGDISKDSLLSEEQPSESVQAVLDHYPAGWINSQQRADAVLQSVDIEKSNIETRLYNEKLICNKKFFVYWCYEQAQQRRNIDIAPIRMLEVEAKRYKRSDDIRQADLQHDKDAIENNDPISVSDRQANVAAYEARLQRVQEKLAQRSNATQGITKTPGAKHAGNLMTPAERAANEQNYQKKQAELIKREQRVARKKAKTQQKRDKKAAEQAENQQ